MISVQCVPKHKYTAVSKLGYQFFKPVHKIFHNVTLIAKMSYYYTNSFIFSFCLYPVDLLNNKKDTNPDTNESYIVDKVIVILCNSNLIKFNRCAFHI